jgi:hypothetical protein
MNHQKHFSPTILLIIVLVFYIFFMTSQVVGPFTISQVVRQSNQQFNPQFSGFGVSIGQHLSYPTIGGNYLYGTSNEFGLILADMSDLNNPRLIHQRALGSVYGIEAKEYKNPYLYAVGNLSPQNKFYIIDPSNPENPLIRGQLLLPNGGSPSLRLNGNFAYVGDASSFRIVDISNSQNPIQLGSIDFGQPGFPSRILALDASRNAIFFGRPGEIKVIDVTNPAAPSLLSTFPYGQGGVDMAAIYNNRLIYSRKTDGNGSTPQIMFIDITDLRNLSVKEIIPISSEPASFAVKSHYLYSKIKATANLTVYDLDTRAIVGTVTNPDDSVNDQLRVSGNVLIEAGIASNALMTFFYDLSNPAAPFLKSILYGNTHEPSVAQMKGVAYETFSNGLAVWDTSNPAVPQLVKIIKNSSFSLRPVKINNGYLYVNDSIFSLADPRNPVLVKQLPTSATDLFLQGNYLYVATGNTKFDVYAITDPPNATLAGRYTFPSGFTSGVSVRGSTAYVSLGNLGFSVLDVSDLSNIRLVRSVPPYNSGFYRKIVFDDNFAYITNDKPYENGVHFYSLASITNPQFVYALVTDSSAGGKTARDLAYEKDHLYISVSRDSSRPGVHVYLLDQNRTAPTLLKIIDNPVHMPWAGGLDLQQNRLFVGDKFGFLNLIKLYQ